MYAHQKGLFMLFVKILLTILFSLSGYTEAAGTLKKQMVKGHLAKVLLYQSDSSIPNFFAIELNKINTSFITLLNERHSQHHSNTTKRQERRTTKRQERRCRFLCKINSTKKWLKLDDNYDNRVNLFFARKNLFHKLFFSDQFFIQRHKDLCVISPRA